MRLKISARQSDLAQIQALMVGDALKSKYPQLEIEFRFRESLGDRNQADPLWKMPERGVFTEDFLSDLRTGETDMVVHSWKDLPTEARTDSEIVATLPRADARDLLLFKKTSKLKPTLKIFSSSPRRETNLSTLLSELFPWQVKDLAFSVVRGNVQTRVRKLLEDPQIDGLIVAKAALDRLLSAPQPQFGSTRNFLRESLKHLTWMVLPLSENPTAAAQGALAIEIRKDRDDLRDLLLPINCSKTFKAVQTERELLSNYGGGCHLAIGVHVFAVGDELALFSKGKTPEGDYFCRKEILTRKTVPRFYSNELWTFQELQRSQSCNNLQLPKDTNFVISRLDAWPEAPQEPAALLWTSGLKTWKNLAKKGVWISGTFDSLGGKTPETKILAEASGFSKNWVTLTHADHPNFDSNGHLKTYSLTWPRIKIGNEKFFYWRSSSQFLKAIEAYPELKNRLHASGPGSTMSTLRLKLSPERVFTFFNESDWRKHVQKPEGIIAPEV